MMNINLEYKKHSKSLISIKDLETDIDISSPKWNFIFEVLLSKRNVFFEGFHLYYEDFEFIKIVGFLSESDKVFTFDKNIRILFKLKDIYKNSNRNLLAELWTYYQYPSLIVFDNDKIENDIVKLFKEKREFKEYTKFNGVYIVYKNVEENVLWITKNEYSRDILNLE